MSDQEKILALAQYIVTNYVSLSRKDSTYSESIKPLCKVIGIETLRIDIAAKDLYQYINDNIHEFNLFGISCDNYIVYYLDTLIFKIFV